MRYSQLPKKLQARVDAQLADGCAKPKRARRIALVRKKQTQAKLVDIPGALLVRIVRLLPKGARRYDYDNYVGGCKQLVDAIVAALGRKSDSLAGNVTLEYEQRRNNDIKKPIIKIEIFKI